MSQYSPIPPGTDADAVASSLDIAERFMGEQVNPAVVERLRKLPWKQVAVLRDQLSEHAEACRQHLADRVFGDEIDYLAVDDGDHPAADDGDDPAYRFLHEELTIHEDSFNPGRSTRRSNVGALKHLALYCEHVVMDDPIDSDPLWSVRLAGWKPEHYRRWINEVADSLYELQPFAELVRSGNFIMLTQPMLMARDYYEFDFEKYDGFVGWILRQQNDDLLSELSAADDCMAYDDPENRDLDEIQAEALEVMAKFYGVPPYHLSKLQAERVLFLSYAVRANALNATTSDRAIAYHLEQDSRIAFGQAPRSGALGPLPPKTAVVAYGVPTVRDISDIVRLRRNEEVFMELRATLMSLADACAADEPGDYSDYEKAIRRHASDIVGPAYDKLRRWQRKARLGTWGSKALGGSVSLGVGGLVTVVSGGAAHGGGGPIGRAAQHLAGKRAAENYEVAELVLNIYKTILPSREVDEDSW